MSGEANSLREIRARAFRLTKFAWVCSDSHEYLSDTDAVVAVAADVMRLARIVEFWRDRDRDRRGTV